MRRSLGLTPFDGLLLLMVLIWGANYSVVKAALAEILPQAFNVLRMAVASAIFLAALLYGGWPRVARRDWIRLAVLGTVGHFVYQVCFMGGLARGPRPRTARSSSGARPSPCPSPPPSPATSACRASSGSACCCPRSASTWSWDATPTSAGAPWPATS